VVCIDNEGDWLAGNPELWLEKLPMSVVEAVLEKNFPWVPTERRHIYAAPLLSG
jgi:hypothetical protein